jgi:lipoyl-dependent peroxiredoxin
MTQLHKILYRASAVSSGGREGFSKSSDGRLEVNLSTPKELGGNGGTGTNPEQMFAAGYSACFLSALKFVAMKEKVKVSEEAKVEAKVGIGPAGEGFGLEVELQVTVPGLDKETVQALVNKAHHVCPYSNATRGNIKVDLNVL